MLIERIMKDPGGAKVAMQGTIYHFKPRADGKHVALVEDEAHAERLLSIPEGYREADEISQGFDADLAEVVAAAAHAAVTDTTVTEARKLAAPQGADEAIELLIKLEAVEPEEAAAVAWPHLFSFDDEGDADAEADEGQGADAEAEAEADTDAAEADAEADAGAEDQPSEPAWHTIGDDDLRAIFEKEIGRKANARAARDTMIALIEAARRGE